MFQVISPVDGSIYLKRQYVSGAALGRALENAQTAQAAWQQTPVKDRAKICTRAIRIFQKYETRHALELAWQMGRPVRYGAGEASGVAERAGHMIDLATGALADIQIKDNLAGNQTSKRFIKRVPVGTVLTIAPWNYPYLTAINSVVPAIMAGNAVILKHSSQTPLCGERLAECFSEAGLPAGLFQALHITHKDTATAIKSGKINYVAFTGSVPAGRRIEETIAGQFIGSGLELGGKDPAYVRADAHLPHAIESLVDGAFFNSGQSCCGIERIYVHKSAFKDFVDGFVDLTKQYILGNPLEQETTLGPLVNVKAAEFVRGQAAEAINQGAQPLIDPSLFSMDQKGSNYLAPQVLINVDHSMRVMSEESFGPIIGIMAVDNDDEAIDLMNDSKFGLTASVWTNNFTEAAAIGDRVQTGTFFANRCDYLDPALAWTGIKNSGRGCTLSSVGYEALTRPKSHHFRALD
ncbi:aldehyde dehydrogenase family protein [bacterium AH-315-J23]|nr:aldehyde dehydrogenase family protein [bacterium AH-315-J23]